MDSPETKPVVDNAVLPLKTSVEVTLPSGGKITVNKLKAGKFYSAQKMYVAWIEMLQKMLKGNVVNSDGNADIDKVKSVLEEQAKSGETSIMGLLSTVGEADKLRLSLLAFCLDLSEEQLIQDYYPEDINFMFKEVIAANDFLDNLGKSVYLTAGNMGQTIPMKA